MKISSFLFSALLALGTLPCFATEEFVIAKDGKPTADILVLPNSDKVVDKAVGDLLRTLTKMTGAKFQKTADTASTPSVVIGLASEWVKAGQGDETVKRLLEASPESFLLQSTPERLLILGRDSAGTSHGIYTVLRDLGCRWYMISDAWEVIPQKKDVRVTADRMESPALKVRILSNGAGAGGASARMLADWSRRNRLGSTYGDKTIHHSYASFVPNTLFKERPELFAWVSKNGLTEGNFQNGLQPCTTHPEVIKMFTEGALARLREYKKRTGKTPLVIPVSPNDGTSNMCRCARCMETGSYGDCALLIANQVAEAIHEEFPETLVGFMAYGRPSALPEKIKHAHPNVLVSVATNYNWKISVAQMLQEWPKIVSRIIVREYGAIRAWNSHRPDNTMPNVEYTSQSFQAWIKDGISGVESEMNNDWATCGLRFWAFAELAWDPSLPPEAVREDFYQHAFGEAVGPMRRYFERWEDGQKATPRTLYLAFQDLEEAANLAKTPEVAERIDQMSLYLYWYLLKEGYKTEKDEEIKNQIALEGDILQYRWRDSYMMQMDRAIYRVHRTAPMGFTREEVSDLRHKTLKHLLLETDETTDLMTGYSKNLVPWTTPSSSEPPSSEEGENRALTTGSYLFRAKAGEKVKVFFMGYVPDGAPIAEKSTSTEDITGAETLPSGTSTRLQLWFLGPEGHDQRFIEETSPEISPTDPFVFSFETPYDGLYRINAQVRDKKNLVYADFRGRPNVLAAYVNKHKHFLSPVRSTTNRTSEVSTLSYFFVPPHTKAFVVSINNSRPGQVTLTTSDGKLIKEISPESNKETLVQVPSGHDNAVWAVQTEGNVRSLTLDGVPPWLATDPNYLLIPKEFVKSESTHSSPTPPLQ